MSNQAALLLLPNLLGDLKHQEVFLPESVAKAVGTLDGLIAESEKGGRRFLSRFETKLPTAQIPIALFNVNTPDEDIDFYLEPILNGERWGLVSDAGLPCIADPGSKLVKRARERGIKIQSFVGPSSILMALMLSGFSGQRFTFHGYLPKDELERGKAIKILERIAKSDGYTQIFMETPYKNKNTLETLLEVLNPETELSVSWDLTLPTQGVLSQKVGIWRKSPLPNLEKKCAIFLIA